MAMPTSCTPKTAPYTSGIASSSPSRPTSSVTTSSVSASPEDSSGGQTGGGARLVGLDVLGRPPDRHALQVPHRADFAERQPVARERAEGPPRGRQPRRWIV